MDVFAAETVMLHCPALRIVSIGSWLIEQIEVLSELTAYEISPPLLTVFVADGKVGEFAARLCNPLQLIVWTLPIPVPARAMVSVIVCPEALVPTTTTEPISATVSIAGGAKEIFRLQEEATAIVEETAHAGDVVTELHKKDPPGCGLATIL